MGGKRLNDKTEDYIIELGLPEYPQEPLSASKIQRKLEEGKEAGEDYVVPESVRTIHAVLKRARVQEDESMKLDREPWSILLNEKAEIPFDPILLELRKVCFEQQIAQQEKHEREQEPIFVIFPVGVARWAVRLHRIAPRLPSYELLKKARQYFRMERIAKLRRKPVDSSYEDLEIVISDPETAPKLKAVFDKMHRKLVI